MDPPCGTKVCSIVVTYRTLLNESSNAASYHQIPSPPFVNALKVTANFEIVVFQVMDRVNVLVGTEVFRWFILLQSSDGI